MALVSIEQWRAERGIVGGLSAIQAGQLEAPAPPPSDLATIEALKAEIARQADLILRLQGALRIYLDREQAAKVQAVAASIVPKTGLVIRRHKLAKEGGHRRGSSPTPGSPPSTPPGPKAA